MSDTEEVNEKPFAAEIAKMGRAACKKCKEKCLKGELRLAKVGPNPFGVGLMKSWYHVPCLFEQFLKQRQTTKRIEGPEDIDGWDSLRDEDKEDILKRIKDFEAKTGRTAKNKNTVIKSPSTNKNTPSTRQATPSATKNTPSTSHATPSTSKHVKIATKDDPNLSDNSFRSFRKLVANITNISSYIEKTKLVERMFTKGSDGSGFKGDVILWCKLLLPGVVKRVYNLQSKQLIKLCSKLFNCDQNEMLDDLEQGDVAETISDFFEKSRKLKPAKSTLTLKDVDAFLEKLSSLSKEDEQMKHFGNLCPKCTSNDLKIIIRLIKHDLRMNAGAKHILDGVHPDAYQAYQSSRDIDAVIKRCLEGDSNNAKHNKTVKATINLMTPVLPMLAEACKSVEYAMKKCPNGMFSEIKYDGERVQVHKEGSDFKYFSRSLKPVVAHKVAHFKDYIPQAFPHGKDLILDSEILMVDTKTGKPLPFGTLGVHKKSEFKDASVCLFVFDCIYYNGEILTAKPMEHRKKILKQVMTEIPNHIVFSEYEEIHKPIDLSAMIAKVLKQGLEGLVLKDMMSIYEPGKRHWLKVKKDYLFGGAMADSADLIVLGAWYGTGKKGGMMSVFLMGCYDSMKKKFCTVTKVHTGHDDETLERLQKELKMIKISGDTTRVPDWLSCTKTMIPDFVAEDPKMQPVWEITGAEFTQHDVHTADGISIRFPRVTKIRDDKTWETATTVKELKKLVTASKESIDLSLLTKHISEDKCEPSTSGTKQLTLTNFVKVNNKITSKRKFSDSSDSEGEEGEAKKVKKENSKSENCEGIENPIPDYFDDVLLYLSDGEQKTYGKWLRYFVAYGGSILTADELDEATHVLHAAKILGKPMSQCPKSAKHVTLDWIKHSITAKKILDYRPYAVQLKANGYNS